MEDKPGKPLFRAVKMNLRLPLAVPHIASVLKKIRIQETCKSGGRMKLGSEKVDTRLLQKRIWQIL
jgi:hypothetical protein